jgi:hypothetical protein
MQNSVDFAKPDGDLEAIWRDYKPKVYTVPLPPIQEIELKRAFFGGMTAKRRKAKPAAVVGRCVCNGAWCAYCAPKGRLQEFQDRTRALEKARESKEEKICR